MPTAHGGAQTTRGRPRWGRILLGIAVIVFLALPCLLAAIAVLAGGNLYSRTNAVSDGRAPGRLTFDAERTRYVIALSVPIDGLFEGLRDGLGRTESRRRYRVYSGEQADARCAITHPDGSKAQVRGDRQTTSESVGVSYLTVGEFDGKGGRTTVACRFDPAKDALGAVRETPLMVHEASSLRYVGWGLFVGVFVLAGLGALLILWGTVWRGGHHSTV
jgi:hypothetical protein